MEIIYADSLFLLDLAADYLLCLTAARLSGLSLKRLRYFAAALLGAAYSVLAVLPRFGFLALPPCKLAMAGIMGLVAYGGEAHPIRCTAVFLAVSAAFGGAVWAVSLSGGAFPNMRVLIFSFAACYIGLSLVAGYRARASAARRERVELSFLGRSCAFSALVDTGNCLLDPLSGHEVLVASPAALAPLFPGCGGLLGIEDPVELVSAASALPELKGKFRLIPFSAVGGGGLLPVFRPESASVGGRARSALMVAVSKSAEGDGFQGIIGAR